MAEKKRLINRGYGELGKETYNLTAGLLRAQTGISSSMETRIEHAGERLLCRNLIRGCNQG
jgi:hypothetical protein